MKATALDRSPPLAPWRWPARWWYSLFALLMLAWTAVESFGTLRTQGIASGTYDQMQQLRLWASAPDPRLLTVDIDERSLADMAGEFGRWPWPRDTLATVLEQAQAQGALAVVFDVLFSDPDRLNPGGDRALEAVVRSGNAGFFPAARLPAALDAASQLHADALPGLALPPAVPAPAPTVAMILPFMKAMIDSQRLGTHTVTLDSDGKVRRFAFTETLPGGWRLRSMAAALAQRLNVPVDDSGDARLIVWRRSAEAYPRVPFSVAWECAEGRARPDCPVLGGRIVVIGATAASLHDLRASPLSNQHMGVDMLATLIDNALHQRSFDELPAWLRWVLGALALSLAWAIVRRGRAGATGRALWALPMLLLAVGYASLHSERVYLDLSLPAAAALTFLSAVTLHQAWRRRRLGRAAGDTAGPWAVACGGPEAESERVERAVSDLAARWGRCISGGAVDSGYGAAAHAGWALWGLPDAASAAEAEALLRSAVPGAWCRSFAVGAEPQRDLLLTLAQALPSLPESPPSTATEKTHAPP